MKYVSILVLCIGAILIYFFFQEHINNFLKLTSKYIKTNIYIAILILILFSLLDTTIGIIGPSGAALFVASSYYPQHFILLSFVSYLGVFIGSSMMYFLARYFKHILKLNTKTKLWCYFKKNSEISVLIFSATAASNVISVLSGVSKMNYFRFVLMTFVGRLIITYFIMTNLLRLIPIFWKNPTWELGLGITLLTLILILILFVIYKWTRKVHSHENSC